MSGGPRSETATGQENPNRRAADMARPAAEKERNRLLPKAKRSKRAGEPQRAARSLDDEIAVDQVPYWVADQR
jgi:hypothetical protein